MKCTTWRLLLFALALCKAKKCNPGKNMTDQFSLGPRSVEKSGWIIIHPPDRRTRSCLRGRDSPFLMYRSVSSCKYLRRYLRTNLHWKWDELGGPGGAIWRNTEVPAWFDLMSYENSRQSNAGCGMKDLGCRTDLSELSPSRAMLINRPWIQSCWIWECPLDTAHWILYRDNSRGTSSVKRKFCAHEILECTKLNPWVYKMNPWVCKMKSLSVQNEILECAKSNPWVCKRCALCNV